MSKDYFREEEQFHSKDRKQFRKERRHAQEMDRSKFKKTDRAKTATPEDESLPLGRVVAITGEGIWVDLAGVKTLCSLKGLIKKEKLLSKNLIAVGDFVRVQISEKEGAIVSIQKRYSVLSRVDISGKQQQLIAVNIDQVLIVTSIVNPPLKPALIDRYLIAAEKGNMQPLIVVNKIDLIDEASEEELELYHEFLKAYEHLGYPILSVSSKTDFGIANLREIMKNKSSVFAGQSGVGKSSLLNQAFHFEQTTGDLTTKTQKGSHTTTTAQLLPLPEGGFCVDTPGIRSFGIWDLKREDLQHHFREFTPFVDECHYADCTHRQEPSCGVQQAVVDGKNSEIRYDSYCSLWEEMSGGFDNRTRRKLE